MDLKSIIKETDVFLEHLGLNEMPFGVYYADTLPEKTFGPKPGVPISFFVRPEVLCGLFTQTTFTTGDVDCVATPFGAGCTNILACPRYYREKGVEKAVLGGFDPSTRKFMKTDELTFTVPLSLYKKMLDALPESMFNCGKAWENMRKKVDRSAKVWGER